MSDKPKILIVEDELINRKILKKVLSVSYTVEEAENGREAWEILTDPAEVFSAILLDIMMPVMNGFALLDQISGTEYESLPVIVMTAEIDADFEQRALEAGAWDFVTKPFNPRVLLSRLKNAIARSQISVYEKMQRLSEHDPLTGVYNRGKMFSATQQMLAEHPDSRFAFLRVDIDRFSLFNASFGEAEGDRLLQYLASIIVQAASQSPFCTYGRTNADIFSICLPYNGDPETLTALADYIQTRIASFHQEYLLEISVGVCLIDNLGISMEDLLFRAALGTAKCKNQYESYIGFYDENAGRRLAQEVVVTGEMQAALDEEQFVVYYQPKYRLSDDTPYGAEALVRWQHPIRGLVPPGEFIPVFESNGFIARLDQYIWEKVCQAIRSWLNAGWRVNPISVNVSRVSLYNPRLVQYIQGLTKKYKISPSLLELEITESAYMSNPCLMQDTIHGLRRAGFTILMDDFGSGYSSLNTLKEIEVDVLKVDMKFLPVTNNTDRGEIILASVIKMANWLGMAVVVEGVETRKQRDFLEGAGCDYVQGYFYARPIPQAAYEEKYLEEHRERGLATGTVAPIKPRHNVTLLVIDDVEADRAVLEEYFKYRYHVHTAESAEAGLAYLKRNVGKVRLILVDNIMPGMSGLDFLTFCQSDAELRSIPKIIITANERKEDQVRAFREGAYDYITKPLVREVVVARVRHVMEISRQLRTFGDVEWEYRHLVEYDYSTGLLTHTAFRQIGNQVLQTAGEDSKALMLVDIDDFSKINDRHGLAMGDQVITFVADRLRKSFRKTDVIGRFGGDEFAVLLSGLPAQEIVCTKAENLLVAVETNAEKDCGFPISVSVGAAFCERNDTMDTLFARADQALNNARARGNRQISLYTDTKPHIAAYPAAVE